MTTSEYRLLRLSAYNRRESVDPSGSILDEVLEHRVVIRLDDVFLGPGRVGF